MPDAKRTSEESLARLVRHDGVLGAAIVGRDGLPLVHRFTAPCNVDVVSAMAAAMVGAADAALLDMAGEEAKALTASSGRHQIHVVGLDDDAILLLVTEMAAEAQAPLLMTEAAGTLRGVLREA